MDLESKSTNLYKYYSRLRRHELVIILILSLLGSSNCQMNNNTDTTAAFSSNDDSITKGNPRGNSFLQGVSPEQGNALLRSDRNSPNKNSNPSVTPTPMLTIDSNNTNTVSPLYSDLSDPSHSEETPELSVNQKYKPNKNFTSRMTMKSHVLPLLPLSMQSTKTPPLITPPSGVFAPRLPYCTRPVSSCQPLVNRTCLGKCILFIRYTKNKKEKFNIACKLC